MKFKPQTLIRFNQRKHDSLHPALEALIKEMKLEMPAELSMQDMKEMEEATQAAFNALDEEEKAHELADQTHRALVRLFYQKGVKGL